MLFHFLTEKEVLENLLTTYTRFPKAKSLYQQLIINSFRAVQKFSGRITMYFWHDMSSAPLSLLEIKSKAIVNTYFWNVLGLHQKAFPLQSTGELYLKIKEKYLKGTTVENNPLIGGSKNVLILFLLPGDVLPSFSSNQL